MTTSELLLALLVLCITFLPKEVKQSVFSLTYYFKQISIKPQNTKIM